MVSDNAAEQAKQVLQNLAHVLRECQSDLSRVVKFTLILREMSDFPVVNAEIEKVWGEKMSARTTIQAVIPRNCLLAIEAVAVVSKL